tara:strand:- start:357 stop:494 length:138 start_codon:yes stop_codon:yes gene_type:complete
MKIVSLKEIWREKCTEKKELGYSKEFIWVNSVSLSVFLGQVSSVH